MIVNHIHKKLYGNNKEMQLLISAQQPEIDRQYDEINRIFNNQFPSIADETGLSQWEQVLGIIPNLSAEDLEFRRKRILDRLRIVEPLTETWLNEWLQAVFPNGEPTAYIDYQDLVLHIDLPTTTHLQAKEVRVQLSWLIPANIALLVRYVSMFPELSKANVYAVSAMSQRIIHGGISLPFRREEI